VVPKKKLNVPGVTQLSNQNEGFHLETRMRQRRARWVPVRRFLLAGAREHRVAHGIVDAPGRLIGHHNVKVRLHIGGQRSLVATQVEVSRAGGSLRGQDSEGDRVRANCNLHAMWLLLYVPRQI
jgi:hypothetical protein